MRGLLFALALLCLGACSAAPFAPPRLVKTVALSASQLAQKHWSSTPAVYRMRHAALLEIGFRQIPMNGFMELNLVEGSARLVAMDSMGIKLFDLSVIGDRVEQHSMIPALARLPQLKQEIARSLRRIFLDPGPASGDVLETSKRSYSTERKERGIDLEFVFGGPDQTLLEKRGRGPGENWTVRYFDYQLLGQRHIPAGILLHDRSAGYRLTLWQQGVKRTDE